LANPGESTDNRAEMYGRANAILAGLIQVLNQHVDGFRCRQVPQYTNGGDPPVRDD
jgi:hypothetical protein